MTLGPLFDLAAGAAAANAAIEQVANATSLRWMDVAARAIQLCADSGDDFTSDEVWKLMGGQVDGGPDGRAMGAAFRAAAVAGIIVATGAYRKSEQVSCHARPKAVWRGTGKAVQA